MRKNKIFPAGLLVALVVLAAVSLALIGCERETELPIPPSTLVTSPLLPIITPTTIDIYATTTTTTTLPQVATPQFVIQPGVYETDLLNVRVNCDTPGADIYYNRYDLGLPEVGAAAFSDGCVKASISRVSTVEIIVLSTCRIKVWAEKDGYRKSDYALGTFEVWWWEPVGIGLNDVVYAFAIGGDVGYAGGDFTVPAQYVAMNRGFAFEDINSVGAPDGRVWALAADLAGNLYAGGVFTNYLLKWDGSAWSTVGGGVDGTVRTLLYDYYTGALYAGGDFTHAGGVTVNRVAKWDGTTWEALGNGIDNNGVFALSLDNFTGMFHVGGSFTSASGVANTRRVASWDIANSTWEALGNGIADGQVWAFASDTSGKHYVGGGFSSASGVAGTANLAVWNDAIPTWESLGGAEDTVYALCWDNVGDLYVGGEFDEIGGQPLYELAKWGTSALTWEAVPGWSPSYAPLGVVNALVFIPQVNYLIVGGEFKVIDGAQGNYVARWQQK
jgi:hypothetical protein